MQLVEHPNILPEMPVLMSVFMKDSEPIVTPKRLRLSGWVGGHAPVYVEPSPLACSIPGSQVPLPGADPPLQTPDASDDAAAAAAAVAAHTAPAEGAPDQKQVSSQAAHRRRSSLLWVLADIGDPEYAAWTTAMQASAQGGTRQVH